MKMSLEIIILVIVMLVLVCSIFYFAKTASAPDVSQPSFGSVCFANGCFQVELAKTAAERDYGLMDRIELDRDKGMLFIFDQEGIYPFWMKNTLIPLDMIWIDGYGKVISISQNVQPCKVAICSTVFPTGAAKYVLEVNAGICQEIGLKVGDKLKITL